MGGSGHQTLLRVLEAPAPLAANRTLGALSVDRVELAPAEAALPRASGVLFAAVKIAICVRI